MMKKYWIHALSAIIFSLSVGLVSAAEWLNIKVTAAGDIVIDGKSASLDEIETAIKDIAAKGGKMCYYRDPAATGKPSDKAMQIRAWVQEHNVPIVVAKNADFSDCK